jgi:hypothetical protein
VSDLDGTGLVYLVVGDGVTVSACCTAPAVAEGDDAPRHWLCMWCERPCEVANTLKVIVLGEAARALRPLPDEDLSLWASFKDVAVAYGDQWAGPGTDGFGVILAVLDAGRQQAAANEAAGGERDTYHVQVPVQALQGYEEFRERWHRERGLPVPDTGRER